MKYLVNNDLHDFEKFLKNKVPYGDLTLMLKDGTTKLYDVTCECDKLGNASFQHEGNKIFSFQISRILYTVDVNTQIDVSDIVEHSPFVAPDNSYFKSNESYIVKYIVSGDNRVNTGILKCHEAIRLLDGKFIFDMNATILSSRKLIL